MIFRGQPAIVNSMRHADTIERKVKTFMARYRMLSPGDRVVAGVSGGADSVCLLFVLLKCREEIPFYLHVVHVNHGIRAEAVQDAAYVEALCKAHGLPFTLVEADVRQRAAEEKRSEEEMGRILRYEAFEKVCIQVNAGKIAVAHNSNDRAETMLFHLFRGSGLTGLCGIRPVRDRIIRPILCLERGEIENYLQEKGISYCRDVTNEEDDYTRNRIRHHIIPYAEKEIARGCVEHMARAADILLEAEELLERLTAQAWKETVRAEGEKENVFWISCSGYAGLDPLIGRRLIRRLLGRLSPGGRDIAHVHIKDAEELFLRQGNREICLPYGIRAERQYDSVRFGLQSEDGPSVTGEEAFDFQVFSCENCKDIPQNRYTKWFDYDKIKGRLTVRTRQKGDVLSIRSADGGLIHKFLKDYMVTEKIPRQDRDCIPLLADGEHILWVVGYRISEYYKVSENTKRILQVQLRRDCESRETEEDNG